MYFRKKTHRVKREGRKEGKKKEKKNILNKRGWVLSKMNKSYRSVPILLTDTKLQELLALKNRDFRLVINFE